jgi:hypothetical protein
MAHLSIRRPYLPSGRPLERSLPKPTSCHSKHISAHVVLTDWHLAIQAFKHVFTSPSSANDDEPKATKSGNARIHGMTTVTKASLAYIATQVRITIYKTLYLSLSKIGAVFAVLYEHIFANRYCHGLRNILH